MELFEVNELESFKEYLKKVKHPVLKYFNMAEIQKAKYSLPEKDEQLFSLIVPNTGDITFVCGKKTKIKYTELIK
jgi:hypothetical protein